MGKLVKSPFDICLNPLIMCKEGWCVGFGHEGVVCVRMGGGGLFEIP